MESGYQFGVSNYTDDIVQSYRPYCGGGFLHLTHDYNYKAFSNALNIPTLLTPPTYATLKVAIEYPGTSAGWFLSVYNKTAMSEINWVSMTDDAICQKLTKIVKGTDKDYTKRLTYFNTISQVLK